MTKETLKQKLKEIGAAQWELANVLGVHVQTVYNWFHCEKLSEDKTEKIEKALEILKEKKSA